MGLKNGSLNCIIRRKYTCLKLRYTEIAKVKVPQHIDDSNKVKNKLHFNILNSSLFYLFQEISIDTWRD